MRLPSTLSETHMDQIVSTLQAAMRELDLAGETGNVVSAC